MLTIKQKILSNPQFQLYKLMESLLNDYISRIDDYNIEALSVGQQLILKKVGLIFNFYWNVKNEGLAWWYLYEYSQEQVTELGDFFEIIDFLPYKDILLTSTHLFLALSPEDVIKFRANGIFGTSKPGQDDFKVRNLLNAFNDEFFAISDSFDMCLYLYIRGQLDWMVEFFGQEESGLTEFENIKNLKLDTDYDYKLNAAKIYSYNNKFSPDLSDRYSLLNQKLAFKRRPLPNWAARGEVDQFGTFHLSDTTNLDGKTSLVITGRLIETISSETFSQIPNIKRLVIYDVQELEYPKNISSELSILSLSLNQGDLPKFALTQTKLLELTLEKFTIKYLPPELAKLGITKLTLDLPNLELIPDFRDLSYMSIRGLANTSAIYNMPTEQFGNLAILNLVAMKLKNQLPDFIFFNQDLEELSLYDTSITELDPRIESFTKIKVIKLLGNPISKFPKVLHKLTSLEELTLDDASITDIDEQDLELIRRLKPTFDKKA
ncbi:MAG: leucine-rich repeat domain-containing protein [Candidatus Parcubacteria bacterium]|nr:leucine-rich repeat domain-containing protein [Candidatus Paceibacterota bacterium]